MFVKITELKPIFECIYIEINNLNSNLINKFVQNIIRGYLILLTKSISSQYQTSSH